MPSTFVVQSRILNNFLLTNMKVCLFGITH